MAAKSRPKSVKTYLRSCVPRAAAKEHRASGSEPAFDDWEQVALVDLVKTRQRDFFGANCLAFYPRGNSSAFGELEIYRIGAQSKIENVVLCAGGKSLKGMVGFGRSGSRIYFGSDSACQVDIRVWRDATLYVGPHTTINNARFVLDDSQVYIGSDAMLSDEILLQAGDQHSIWNLDDNTVANVDQPPIVIREHAWIGRRVTLMAGASIGCGSIVGTASVVTGEVADFALAVGVPARVIKQHVTWSRNVEWFSPLERDFLARRRPLAGHPAIEPAK